VLNDSSGFIYTLSDPETLAVRYVGQTRVSVEQRLKGHLGLATHGHAPLSVWLRSLKEKGKKPAYREVEFVTRNLSTRELYWINFYEKAGAPLLNVAGVVNANAVLRARQEAAAIDAIKAKILDGFDVPYDSFRKIELEEMAYAVFEKGEAGATYDDVRRRFSHHYEIRHLFSMLRILADAGVLQRLPPQSNGAMRWLYVSRDQPDAASENGGNSPNLG
jgi:hypothetical protein